MIDFLPTISFSEEEISVVETQFFGTGNTFNPEQRSVINCFSKENIQACPGSGKTTTLAAKLLLLKNRLHKGINGGICILTHTNVAVEMIRERLGADGAAFYNNYPNYLGTIQSFINKYLAIPAYRAIYKKSLEAIDDDIYYAIINRRHLEAVKAEIVLSNQRIEDIGIPSFNIHNFDISLKNTLSEPFGRKETPSYQQLEKLKLDILEKGYLKYGEAYSLAFRYLREHPKIGTLFSKRFPLVFLDEMQDTEDFQSTLLNKLFNQGTILQTIGDANQDIYGNYENIASHWPTSTAFSIATSSRFPQNIANVVQKTAVVQQILTGKHTENTVPVHILVYKDATINNVKDKFGEIIINCGLHQTFKSIFKAVGARKDAGHVNITSYFPDFNKRANKIRENYGTLEDYLNAMTFLKTRTKNIKGFKDLLSSLILQVLKLAAVRDIVRDRLFTAASLERYLGFADPILYKRFRFLIAGWIKEFLAGQDIRQTVTAFIKSELLPHFTTAPNAAVDKFLTGAAVDQGIIPNAKHNIHEASHSGETVNIVFDTIHGVKGETHTATLFLETFNRAYDIEKVLPLISGTQNRTNSYINANKTRMKQAYVAMSRPTNLLCLAVHEDRINLNTDWTGLGFIVVHCS